MCMQVDKQAQWIKPHATQAEKAPSRGPRVEESRDFRELLSDFHTCTVCVHAGLHAHIP